MKKLFSIIAVASLPLALAACEKDNPPQPVPPLEDVSDPECGTGEPGSKECQ